LRSDTTWIRKNGFKEGGILLELKGVIHREDRIITKYKEYFKNEIASVK